MHVAFSSHAVHRLRQGLAHILESAMGDMATLAALLLSATNEISASPNELKDLKLLPSDKFELEQPKCWATFALCLRCQPSQSSVDTCAAASTLYLRQFNQQQQQPELPNGQRDQRPKAESRKPRALG